MSYFNDNNTKNNSQIAESYLTSANQYLEQGNPELALSFYNQAIELNPDNDHIYYKLGQTLMQLERYEDAITAYSKSIQINPDFPWSYNSLGEVLIKLERWEEAIAAYTQFIKFNNNFCWAYFGLGESFFKLNQIEKSINYYEKAIKFEPTNCWIYIKLGDALLKLDQPENAIKSYSQAIQLNPNIDWFYEKLAETFLSKNQLDNAIQAYQNAITINPQSWHYIEIGKILIQQELWDLALDYLIKGLQIQPDYHEAYDYISTIFKQKNQLLDAILCEVHHQLPIRLIQKIFNLSDDHFITTHTEKNLTKIPVYPLSNIELTPPKFIEGSLNPHFQLTSINFPETFVYSIPQGKVWADTLTSAVLNSENQLITDLSTGSAALLVNSPHLIVTQNIGKIVAFLSVKWGENYYHWMFDIIARFGLLLQHFLIEEIDYFVVNRCQLNYEQETLKLLNIPAEKIIESCKNPFLKADKLLIPSYSHATSRTPKWACNFLKNLCLNYPENLELLPLERVYLSRSQASYRQVDNEAEVILFLQQFGFTVLSLETLSVRQQAYYMANTKVIISPHGAALTNLVFCSPGTQVIEFLMPNWTLSCYWELSNIVGCDYYCLFCEPADFSRSPTNGSQNIKVNLDSLLKLMQWAGVV
ncbi:TPR domain protein [Planktothrix agardhii CCAP 1459/11A]|uniref:TPR domain protein n=1 Tax=Planktothrix agardhii CCAP 1459/11A TaxID=282420 RepID=A0A4P5ZJC3_PLAAG|nr:tetratricopeptide repeat protein [Planktothrix agardhii]GDZ95503.1 TPR domain protein [Planktothrix agardhii CCAP 1459/11A]